MDPMRGDVKLGKECWALALFCAIGAALPAKLVAAEESQSSEAESAATPLCTTALRLSGTVYDAHKPERSFALLHVQANHAGEVYREGAWVAGLELDSIEPRGVVMRGESGTCWLNIMGTRATHQPAARPKRAPQRRAAARPASKRAFSRDELERNIHAKGEHAYQVERSLLPAVVGRVAKLASTTRLEPVRHYGHVAGLQLQALADDGLLAHLGLARGDLLKSLNGVPLIDIGDMLRAQELLKSTPRLSLLVMRQGVPVAIDYQLVN